MLLLYGGKTSYRTTVFICVTSNYSSKMDRIHCFLHYVNHCLKVPLRLLSTVHYKVISNDTGFVRASTYHQTEIIREHGTVPKIRYYK